MDGAPTTGSAADQGHSTGISETNGDLEKSEEEADLMERHLRKLATNSLSPPLPALTPKPPNPQPVAISLPSTFPESAVTSPPPPLPQISSSPTLPFPPLSFKDVVNGIGPSSVDPHQSSQDCYSDDEEDEDSSCPSIKLSLEK